jgi:hypothetical protein
MLTLSPEDMAILRSLNGYDLTLEVSKMSTKYGLSGEQIMASLTQNGVAGYSASGEYDPTPKNIAAPPALENNYKDYSSSAQVLDKSKFRFEYDPTPGVEQRRQKVDQAIMCPGCGVPLGIPAIRPIKVRCPQCIQETTFTS